ncbi:MAG: PEGA domain-containing protein, partial [Candidatus Eremiobacteraeota bacterium]|nr:PEGA domain-containing protein [Candidatus Eremiobacteraeota bacterium]
MKTALRNAFLVLAVASTVGTTGCSKLFKKTVIPSGQGTPRPSTPPAQATCVQGTSAQTVARHAQALTPAVLTVDSNPRGLQVEVNGAYVGATPQQTTPPYATTLTKITVLNGNGGNDYQACYAQGANPNLTIYYNRSADTQGKITTIQSAERNAQSAVVAMDAVRRSASASSSDSAPYSASAVEVRYRAGAISKSQIRGEDIAPFDAPIATRVVQVAAGQSIGQAMQDLRAQKGVLSAEPVQMRFLKSKPPIAAPNDPHFSATQQWDMITQGMLNAWSYTTGAATVKVAVIDTGLDTDPSNTSVQADLIPKLDYAESVLTTGSACGGTQVVTPGNAAVQDQDGHGTNVAGIATA